MRPQFTPELRQRIIDALTERNAMSKCPRCDHPDWTLMDGWAVFPIQQNAVKIRPDGPSVVAFITFCNNCGFLSFHAAAPLGLRPDEGAGPQ